LQPLVYLVEGLYLVLFLATLRRYVLQRDPVSRDLALVFSPLAGLFVVEAWGQFVSPVPDPVNLIWGALLLLQPVFTLHLVSLVRPVPRRVLWLSLVLVVATALPVLLVQDPDQAILLAAVAVFVAIEATAAIYLLLEAVRRDGPVAVRMGLAAVSTGVFGAALFVAAGSAFGVASADASRITGVVLVLVAGIGYFLAFLTPGPVRRSWQASTTVEYMRDLIARSGEPVASIWAGFVETAVRMQGGSAVMITGRRTGGQSIAAAAGVDMPAQAIQVAPDDLEVLLASGRRGWDIAVRDAGPLAERLAGTADARFASVVPIAVPEIDAVAVLVLLSTHRALFHVSDFELLAALGAQTAIVAERSAVMAEQEALAGRLATTVEALRSASAAKSDFVASMSHEFRTPLSAIIGFSELMSTEPRNGELVTVPIEWVDHVQRGGQHLLALVNDVLDLARVEAGRLDLRPESVDVGLAVTEAVNGLRPLADRKNLRIETDARSMNVVVDRGRFRQILYNLISNAIKYTPDGGFIRVTVSRSADSVRVSVADTGVGIAAEDHARVFEEFRQVGDPADRQPGSGLGLTVTKRLAEAHDGRIELVSARGEGSTFTLVLPSSDDEVAAPPTMAPAASVQTLAERTVRTDSAAHDILVIEDDPSAVRLLREYLETAGYRVRVASTGEIGIDAALSQRPAAIVLDVLLPGIDGWEVLRRLKADERVQEVPVVIVTVVEERDVGLALGAVDYLVKPVHRESLLGCLARYVTPAASGDGPRRVLVVDDEPSALELIRGALEPEGVEVVTAQGGREALDWAEHGKLVDLVVCDLVMPDIDGFDVIAALKRNHRTASLPIVVCTGHDLSADQKARLNGQILGIVAKGQDARVGLLDWLDHAVPTVGR
jgi:signal transduction histidine kinase/CheY-like chemotaxis protein